MPEQQPVPIVQPAPVPMTYEVEAVAGGLIRITVRSVTGAFVFFLPADTGRELAGLIDRACLQARSGLIVPNGQIPKPEDPERN